MANFLLAFIAALIIIFIWLLWLRQILMSFFHKVEHHQSILQKDLQKRRDTVPLLLESYRETEETNDAWRQILNARKEFHNLQALEKEWKFERILLHFLRSSHSKSLHFLEAKKDIQDLTKLIEKEKLTLENATQIFKDKSKHFPYNLASAIFGLR